MTQLLQHILGLNDPSSNWYLFWSGFFGDITIFAGMVAIFFHHNCHVKGCPRWGKHKINGSPYCTKHHEDVNSK